MVRRVVLCSALLAFLPLAAVRGQEEQCAALGEKSKQCGGTGGKRAANCCPGLVCYANRRNANCISPDTQGAEEAFLADDAPVALPAQDIVTVVTTAATEAVAAPVGSTAEPSPANDAETTPPPECAGYGERAIECGELDPGRPGKCCGGYMCYKDKFPDEEYDGPGDLKGVKCTNIDERTAPLKPIEPMIQDKPFELNDKILAVGTHFAAAGSFGEVKVRTPRGAEKDDMLVVWIAGSGSVPGAPSGNGWKEIASRKRRSDLNLVAYYKWHDGSRRTYTVQDGRNTFVILTAVRGVDKDKPIVDAHSVKNSFAGKDGRAVAPRAFAVPGGISIATFVYDDPQVPQIVSIDDGAADPSSYFALTTSNTGTGDGMAAFASSVQDLGYTRPVQAAGTKQMGGGNDLTMTISLRPLGGPYDEPPPGGFTAWSDAMSPTAGPTAAPSGVPTASPTGAPTRAPRTTAPVVPGSPTHSPTNLRTSSPVASPTASPSLRPTADPTEGPTDAPVANPTEEPTAEPIADPTASPVAEEPNDEAEGDGNEFAAASANSGAAGETEGISSVWLLTTAVAGVLGGIMLA